MTTHNGVVPIGHIDGSIRANGYIARAEPMCGCCIVHGVIPNISLIIFHNRGYEIGSCTEIITRAFYLR